MRYSGSAHVKLLLLHDDGRHLTTFFLAYLFFAVEAQDVAVDGCRIVSPSSTHGTLHDRVPWPCNISAFQSAARSLEANQTASALPLLGLVFGCLDVAGGVWVL